MTTTQKSYLAIALTWVLSFASVYFTDMKVITALYPVLVGAAFLFYTIKVNMNWHLVLFGVGFAVACGIGKVIAVGNEFGRLV